MTAPVLNLKLPDVATTYNGLSDFPSWLEKLEMVSKLQGWKELQNVIPLYLVDGALAVYNSLEDKVKADYKAMVAALRRAFCKTRLSAFEAFTMRRFQPGEPIDFYAAELRRMAGLVDESVSVHWVKCAFIQGLPDGMRQQMVAACTLDEMSLSAVIERARALVGSQQEPAFGAVSHNQSVGPSWRRNVVCYNCGKTGHVQRECNNRHGGKASGRDEINKPQIDPRPKDHTVRCFQCSGYGHFAAQCPSKDAKNA